MAKNCSNSSNKNQSSNTSNSGGSNRSKNQNKNKSQNSSTNSSKNANDEREIASITKIMTALLAMKLEKRNPCEIGIRIPLFYRKYLLVPRVCDVHMLTKRGLLWNLKIYH